MESRFKTLGGECQSTSQLLTARNCRPGSISLRIARNSALCKGRPGGECRPTVPGVHSSRGLDGVVGTVQISEGDLEPSSPASCPPHIHQAHATSSCPTM